MTTELATAGAPALRRPPTWAEALTPFLDLQNSPQTRRAYRVAVAEAMAALAVEHPAEITAPMLAAHRAALVARLDAKGERRLAPSSVSLKLAALRGYLKFCRLTGILQLTAEVIAYTLESPSAKVLKPYEILTPAEQRRVLDSLAGRPRDRALVALALGAVDNGQAGQRPEGPGGALGRRRRRAAARLPGQRQAAPRGLSLFEPAGRIGPADNGPRLADRHQHRTGRRHCQAAQPAQPPPYFRARQAQGRRFARHRPKDAGAREPDHYSEVS